MSTRNADRRGSGGGTLLIVLMIVAFLMAFGNFYWLTVKNAQDRSAFELAAQIQVLSQQIVTYATASVNGNLEAFTELEKTRDVIESAAHKLNDGDPKTNLPAYKNESSLSEKLGRLTASWVAMKGRVNKILENKSKVLEAVSASESLQSPTRGMPYIKSLMQQGIIELLRDKGTASQVSIVSKQILTGEQILRHANVILTGGSGSGEKAREEEQGAVDGLSRDEVMFGNTLAGLLNGNTDIKALESNSAREFLKQSDRNWQTLRDPLAKLMDAAPTMLEIRGSLVQISLDSGDLLLNADSLSKGLDALPTTRKWPNTYVSLVMAAIGLVFFLAFLLKLFRDQQRRYQATSELNQRNQEAILRLLDEMGSLAEGDLTVTATVTEDITGAIADSVNFAVDALRSLVTTINETAVQVSAAAQETQATAMHLAEAAEHQAQQITSASAAINQIAVSIDDVSKNSAESADVAHRSVEIAAKGASIVRQTIQGMDSIRDQIQETSKRIKRLGESSQEIGSIVELINDIAEQTNILALNAAIQAASAGEAGRGFAVVADEVQRLAERASGATKRIETLVKTIQSDTHEAVSSMEQTTSEVVAGARLAEDAGLALGEIEKVSNDLSDLIQNISEAARQQSAAATNISSTMNLIQEITTQTSVGASQTAESIGNLAQLAADLRRSVMDFKLPA